MKAIVLVLTLAAASFAVGKARAAEKCEIGAADIERAGSYALAVDEAVTAAPDCDTAFARLEVCSLGSSADNALSDTVVAKCEKRFVGKAGAATKKAYKTAQTRCDVIAERNSGSMYQSFAAVCRAKASRDFARKYGGAK